MGNQTKSIQTLSIEHRKHNQLDIRYLHQLFIRNPQLGCLANCHTLISFESTCGRSLNLVFSLRNPRNKHRCIIHKVSQHFGRKNKHRCVIHEVSQHSGRKNKHRCVIRKVLQYFRRKTQASLCNP